MCVDDVPLTPNLDKVEANNPTNSPIESKLWLVDPQYFQDNQECENLREFG